MSFPEIWASSATAEIEVPSAGTIQDGFSSTKPPSAGVLNWLLRTATRFWRKWTDLRDEDYAIGWNPSLTGVFQGSVSSLAINVGNDFDDPLTGNGPRVFLTPFAAGFQAANAADTFDYFAGIDANAEEVVLKAESQTPSRLAQLKLSAATGIVSLTGPVQASQYVQANIGQGFAYSGTNTFDVLYAGSLTPTITAPVTVTPERSPTYGPVLAFVVSGGTGLFAVNLPPLALGSGAAPASGTSPPGLARMTLCRLNTLRLGIIIAAAAGSFTCTVYRRWVTSQNGAYSGTVGQVQNLSLGSFNVNAGTTNAAVYALSPAAGNNLTPGEEVYLEFSGVPNGTVALVNYVLATYQKSHVE